MSLENIRSIIINGSSPFLYIKDNYERLVLLNDDFISIIKYLYLYDEMKEILDEKFIDNAVRCNS